MRKLIDLVEGYEGAFNTRGKTCEIFRNPTRKEFKELGGEIRAFLDGDDVLMWNAYGALHQEVRENLKLDKDAISLEIWSEGYGNGCLVMVTDNTRQTKWMHNPDIVSEITSNRGLRAMFDHISIEYFDQAIYGEWDDLADHGDIHDEDELELEEADKDPWAMSDEQWNLILKGHRTYNRTNRRSGEDRRKEDLGPPDGMPERRSGVDRRHDPEEIDEASGAHTPPEHEDGDEAHYDALKQTGFFGAQAAGCIAMARTTGRILVVLRSAGVEQPYTWGNVGGAHHADEQPAEAAERELYEETGYHGRCEMVPLMVFTKGTFRYCNFLALVDDEFVPVLGWEADDYKWVEFGHWPQPLHFGLQALFNDARSVAVIKSYESQGEKK